MKSPIDPRDAVLDEIHAARRQLLLRYGGVAGLASFLRKQEAETDRQIATPSPPKESQVGRGRRLL